MGDRSGTTTMPIATVECAVCHTPLSRTTKNFRKTGGYYRRTCRKCETLGKSVARQRRKKDWKRDWAWLYQHKLNKQLRSSDASKGNVNLEPMILRAIMKIQLGNCALTRQKLYLPENRMDIEGSWVDWLKTLTHEQLRMTPVLVRNIITEDDDRGWVKGNVFYIAAWLYEMYTACGSLKKFREACLACSSDIVVIAPEEAINRYCKDAAIGEG